jgi:hypothetical protein
MHDFRVLSQSVKDLMAKVKDLETESDKYGNILFRLEILEAPSTDRACSHAAYRAARTMRGSESETILLYYKGLRNASRTKSFQKNT